MMGPKPKPPKESRVVVEEEIRAMLARHSAQGVMGILFPFFTTIDLVGIRDQLQQERRNAL